MKACCVYKTKKHFKFVTMYQTDTGSYVLRDPIHLLDVTSSVPEVQEKLFDCLKASKVIPYPEQSFAKELLKKLKEPSYKNLYLNSTSCNIYLEKNTVTIEPNMCKHPDEGLEVVTEDIQTVPVGGNEAEVTRTIMSVLDKKYT